jgi:DNA-binding CsgD family transcriptional regulator
MHMKHTGTDPFGSVFWRATVALALLMFATSLMNMVVFPLFDTIFTYARDISITANALVLVLIGVLATFRPRYLSSRIFITGMAVCLGAGSLMLAVSLAGAGGPVLLVVSSSLMAIGRAGAVVMVGLAASHFGVRQASICVTVGFTISYACTALAWVVPMWMGVALFLVLPLVAFGLTVGSARPLLDEAAAGEAPADVAITRPSTFLPLASQLFVCILLFRMAFGYSLRFGETGGVPVSDFLVLVPVAATMLYVVLGRRSFDADLAARISVVLVVAGFFLVTADSHNLSVASNVLLSAGNTLFDMVAWTVLISISARNRAGALAVFAWGRGMSGLGTLAGAALGVWSNSLFSSNRDLLIVVSGSIVVLFVAYAIIGLGRFSFKETIEGITSTAMQVEAATNPEEEFDARCADVAAEYGLSPRELEVLKMLARGRDRAYIEEKLVVSRNTVKAHVKHIYAKLGIHSHQDLIALVQGE